MRAVALIPARGGSKRVPRKNVIDLCGKPLIAYTIEAAKGCKAISEVWVSTDDDEIAEVSQNFGASVVRRPALLASDTASSESALLHFAENANSEFDILCFMQATSPLTRSEHISEGIELVANRKADSCLAVSEDVRFYWNARRLPINYDPLHRPFSQEKEKWYKETGAWYITTRESLFATKCRLGGRVEFVVVPELHSFEIDSFEDLKIVETILKSSQESAS